MHPTLFEWADGAEALARLTEVFYREVHRDPVLAPVFAHAGDDHAQHVALWLGEVFGGPPSFTDERGGYPAMLSHHLGLSITASHRARWAQLIAEAADEAGLPADPEFRSAFVAYVERGSWLAVENSQVGATPPPVAPVPRWGWVGLGRGPAVPALMATPADRWLVTTCPGEEMTWV